MSPPCERFVPGYGDANADFHVLGDHPGVHGGIDTGVPFTGKSWSPRFLDALVEGGLLADADAEAPTVDRTFFSYLHLCVPECEPSTEAYADLERFFDAELRAIAAHVLLPVGERVTRHVLETYTSLAHRTTVDMERLHATELRGAGWLVVPIKSPDGWDDDHASRLVDGLRRTRRTDFRRESDLGRFIAGDDPYLVR